MRLHDRVVVVTGAGRGLGEAMAHAVAHEVELPVVGGATDVYDALSNRLLVRNARDRMRVALAPGQAAQLVARARQDRADQAAGCIGHVVEPHIHRHPPRVGEREDLAVPVLGALFRSSEYQREQTELVVIVTPHLVTPTRGERTYALAARSIFARASSTVSPRTCTPPNKGR